MIMAKQKKYTELTEELETILEQIDNEDISVDELAQKVKRATKLITLCKAILTETEEQVNEMLKDMDEE